MQRPEFLVRHRDRINEAAGVLLLTAGLVILLALLSYSGTDASWSHAPAEGADGRNWMGRLGATAAEWLLQLFGVVAFLAPAAFALLGWNRLRRQAPPAWGPVVGCAVLALSLGSLVDLLFDRIVYGGATFSAGGVFGALAAGALRAMLDRPGAMLVSSIAVAAVVVLTSRTAFFRTLEIAAALLRRGFARVVGGLREAWEDRRRPAEPPEETALHDPRARPAIDLGGRGPAPAESNASPGAADAPDGAPRVSKPAPRPAPAKPVQAALPIDKGKRGYSLPPLELLKEPEPQSIEGEQELLDRAKQITAKLQEFNVGGTVVAVHPGPVVTTFEFKPDAGVKYSKITSMTDDLSLALKAESVRIARMPQRSTVGIEVPNRRKETIFPREIIGSETFRGSTSKLPLALGKDITGEGFVAELDRMPHLLIAGATGAGKSVGLNGMIVSLLYKATPVDLRFIMIDTKMIELGIYADIPHLLIPVVTEPKKAATALKWAVREMEARYRRLAAVGVRNLAQFNALLEKEPDRTMPHPKTGEDMPLERLPYIVIVIDEMADLMMVSSSEVEEAIMRLAQMARAVGIHLILATQRPSVDVITGTIKANFPSRIAYRVSQRVDSRTIIDQQGAEHLLGRGDMLFLATGASRVIRLHGGYITESEINRITSYLKKMAEPVYDETVLAEGEESRGGAEGGDFDEMYPDAVRTVIQEGKCSITLIQRRLQLGYARAARIVDMMEGQGVVSPGEGSKPREILVGPDYLERLEAEL